MPRYFIEVGYHGAGFAGFQKQQNANTIQSEVEKALGVYLRTEIDLTGSSRTDSGVHARQNYFHFDTLVPIQSDVLTGITYHLNAILPNSIVAKAVFEVGETAHSRFDALSRTYEYTVYQEKDPFLSDRAFFYPYELNIDLLNAAAKELFDHSNFQSFSKKSTQVFTYNCAIEESEWRVNDKLLIYRVTANRFLRGMVRGLAGTMLRSARNKSDINSFRKIITSLNPSLVDFSVPPQGLMLMNVKYPYPLGTK